jgi:hypothetical protein
LSIYAQSIGFKTLNSTEIKFSGITKLFSVNVAFPERDLLNLRYGICSRDETGFDLLLVGPVITNVTLSSVISDNSLSLISRILLITTENKDDKLDSSGNERTGDAAMAPLTLFHDAHTSNIASEVLMITLTELSAVYSLYAVECLLLLFSILKIL